jgi:hypothetical protein
MMSMIYYSSFFAFFVDACLSTDDVHDLLLFLLLRSTLPRTDLRAGPFRRFGSIVIKW